VWGFEGQKAFVKTLFVPQTPFGFYIEINMSGYLHLFFNMKNTIWLVLFGIGFSLNSTAQTVDFLFGATYGEEENLVDVPVFVSNFNDISGMQFTITWDSMALHFVEAIDIQLAGMEQNSFFLLEEGILTVSVSFDENMTVPDNSQIFGLRFLLANACENIATLNITGEPTPALAFTFDLASGTSTYYGLNSMSENITTFCPLEATADILNADCTENGGIDLMVTGGIPPYNFNWNNGELSEDLTDLDMGSYQVTILDDIGNELVVDNLAIDNLNPIVLELGNDTTLCDQTDYLIELNATGNIATLEWYLDSINLNAGGNFELLAMQTGVYSVVATDAMGCTNTDAILIVVNDPIDLSIDNAGTIICPQDSIELMVSGATTYEWISGTESLSAATIANPIAFPAVATTYTVIGSNDCQSDTTSIYMDLHKIQSFAGADTCIVKGQIVQLTASGGVGYVWEENEFLSSSLNIQNPMSEPSFSTSYVVYITDENDCIRTDSMQVEVVDNPLDLIVPINVITPNDDGKNDFLKFGGLNKFNNYKLTVFNRWGNVVFDQLNYNNDWDGTFNGEPLPAGSYYYILRVNQGEIKSALTILRD
jgi:gliding motility-associated-like protein